MEEGLEDARDALFEKIMDRFSADPELNITARPDWRDAPMAEIMSIRRLMIDPIIDETLAFMAADIERAEAAANDVAPPMRVAGDQEPPAIVLLREAAVRFREYEAHHREAARAASDRIEHDAAFEQLADERVAKAERNGELAGKIEAFLAYRESMLRGADPGHPPGSQEFAPAPANCGCGASHAPGCPNTGEGQIRRDGSVAYHRPALQGIITEVQHSIGSQKPVTLTPGSVGAGVVVLPTGQPRVILKTKHPDGTSVAGVLTASGLATLMEILEESGNSAQAISDAAAQASRN